MAASKPSQDKDSIRQEMEEMDAPDELIDEVLFSESQNDFELFHENEPAIQLFWACSTQWITAPMGGVTGLNYNSVESVLNIWGVRDKKKMFNDLRLVESGFLKELQCRKSMK